MSTFFSNSNPTTWQEAVKQLNEANQQFKRLHGIMTPLEKQFITQEIIEAREKYRSFIENGVLAEFSQAQTILKERLANLEREKARVINGFDQGQLAASMQVASMRIDHAAKNGDLDSLQAIYQEAKDSGDRVKQKAVAEALQSVTSKFPASALNSRGKPAKRGANILESQAARDLLQFQTGPELDQAHQTTAQAVDQLDYVRRQMVNVSETMSDRALSLNQTFSIPLISSFEKALERCTQDASGKFTFTDEVKPIPPQPARQYTETEKSLYQIKE